MKEVVIIVNSSLNKESANGVNNFIRKLANDMTSIVETKVIGFSNSIKEETIELEGNYKIIKIPEKNKSRIEKYISKSSHVIINGVFNIKLYSIVKKLVKLNINYSVVGHGGLGIEDPKKIKTRLAMHLFQQFILDNAIKIYCLNSQELINSNIYTSTNAELVPQIFDNPNTNNEVRVKKSNNPMVGLYLGRINPIKGIKELLDVSKYFINEIKFNVAGPTDNEYAQRMIRKRQIDNINNVNFIGPKYGQEKSKLFLESDFIILPSRGEGYPLTILEAMSFGLPVIVTNLPEVGEEIREYQAGIIIEDEGLESIKKAIDKFLNLTDEEYLKMSGNAMKLVTEKHTDNHIVRSIYEYYN